MTYFSRSFLITVMIATLIALIVLALPLAIGDNALFPGLCALILPNDWHDKLIKQPLYVRMLQVFVLLELLFLSGLLLFTDKKLLKG